MIRDPSDGSVKSAPVPYGSLPSGESEPTVTSACAGADTGLAPVEKDRAVRLKLSREWLASYHAKKAAQ